jgi:hypothetical protein
LLEHNTLVVKDFSGCRGLFQYQRINVRHCRKIAPLVLGEGHCTGFCKV